MKRIFIFLVALLGIGCMITRGRSQSEYKALSENVFPIKYDFYDVPAERRIELRFRNDFEQTICLLLEVWPNQAGKIQAASGTVVLIIGERRFPVEKFEEYCPHCVRSVAPGETIIGSISYADFHLPEELINEEKRLEFVPIVYFCEKRKK